MHMREASVQQSVELTDSMLSYMLCVAMEPNGDDDSVTPEELPTVPGIHPDFVGTVERHRINERTRSSIRHV